METKIPREQSETGATNAGTVVKQERVVTADGAMDVTMRVLGKTQTPGHTSTQTNIIDPFVNDYGSMDVLAPPHDPLLLAQMIELSPGLGRCTRTMTTNVVGFGYDFTRLRSLVSAKELPSEAKEERHRLDRLFRYPNYRESFIELSERLWTDYECIGWLCMEVVRDRKADICELHRLPGYSMRKTRRDTEETEWDQACRDDDGKYEMVPRRTKFRRLVQRMGNGRKVYFKEFGDPRLISSSTGKEVEASKRPANEVIVLEQACSYTTYGMPRWLANLMGLVGARKAETVNLLYFDNKAIPPVVITVSGGSLTSATVDRLKELFEKQVKGLDNYHNGLILEAVPHQVGTYEGEKITPVKIEIKPLTMYLEKDGQFLKYQDRVEQSVRSDFRLPPIYLGNSDDYNRATSVEAARVAEEQVFGPARRPFEYLIQNTILADMQIKYWDFGLLGAKTSDYSDMLASIAGVKEMIPIGVVQQLVNDMLNTPAEDIPEPLFQTLLSQINTQIDQTEQPTEEGASGLVTKLLAIREQLKKRLDERVA